MGLQPIKNPGDMPDSGLFQLPPGFPVDKLASEWVEQGRVQFKQQRENLIGTGYSADGWTIYRANPEDRPTEVVTGDKKRFVLMVRERDLQNQINKLYGNVSKMRINREVQGETVAGNGLQDSGILTAQALRNNQVGGQADETALELNSIEQPAVPST